MSHLFGEMAARRQGRLEVAKTRESKNPYTSDPGPFYGKPMAHETQEEANEASGIADDKDAKAAYDYHRRMKEKYSPGGQSVPNLGVPNLNRTEKEELAPDIDMKPR